MLAEIVALLNPVVDVLGRVIQGLSFVTDVHHRDMEHREFSLSGLAEALGGVTDILSVAHVW